MILSDIVKFKNLLDGTSIDPACEDAIGHLAGIVHMINSQTIELHNVDRDLISSLDNVKDSVARFDNVLVDLSFKLQQTIDAHEPTLYAQSQQVYAEEMCFDTDDYILDRQLHIDQVSDEILRSRLRSYTDWRLPGMIIRPGKENFIEELVPLDPLYLIDHNKALLAPAVAAFTPEYQRRLREYTVDDYSNQPIMSALPDNQFGLVFAYNYFNYKPIGVIQRYLQALIEKLRPGGVMLFTYNNCDQWHGVALAEKCFMSYVPGRKLRQIAESIGYEITHDHDGQGNVSWIELRKPGTIVSLRGGQSLAKIIAIQQ